MLHRHCKNLWSLVLLSLSASAMAEARTLRIETMVFPPYVTDTRDGQALSGLLIEILDGISSSGKLRYNLRIRDLAEIGRNLRRGTNDAVLGLLHAEDRLDYVYYPKVPLYNIRFSVVSLRNDVLQHGQIDTLDKDLWYVTLQWATLGPEIDRFLRQVTRRTQSSSFDLMIKMIVSRRADLAIIPKLTAEYYASMHEPAPNVSELIISQLPLYMAFSKRSLSPSKRNEWEQAMLSFLKSPAYQALIDRYEKRYH